MTKTELLALLHPNNGAFTIGALCEATGLEKEEFVRTLKENRKRNQIRQALLLLDVPDHMARRWADDEDVRERWLPAAKQMEVLFPLI